MRRILTVCFLLVSVIGQADVTKIKSEESACLEKAESNMDMKMCEADAFHSADAELNIVFGKIVSDLKKTITDEEKNKVDPFEAYGAETLKRLVKSERAWIAFRDANCSYIGANMLNGTGEGLLILSCEAEMTLTRLTQLIVQPN